MSPPLPSSFSAAASSPRSACTHCGLPIPHARRDTVFCCYGCHLAHDIAAASSSGGAPNTLLIRLGVGVFLTMNLMVFNWLITWRHVFDHAAAEAEYAPLAALVSYGLFFLCTLIVVILAAPLAADVMSRSRFAVDADLLILIGVGAAYVLSAINTFRGDDRLYFDTAAVILVLVTLGRYLDARTRAKAAADAGDLLADLPDDDHAVGDVVTVAAGMTIPVDGDVVSGSAHVDEAALTGESQPRAVSTGDAVLAGTISLDGMLQVRATAVGGERAIALMQRMLDDARQKQPRIAMQADRIASWFVPMVVALAAGVFAYHAWRGEASRGLFDALSVLLISCPCALGLAAPLATYAALGRAARRGILVDSGQTLERAAAVRHVCFDKTGTLTRRAMRLTAMEPNDDDLLRIAASIELGALHPIGQALRDAAAERGMQLDPPANVTVLPGRGLRAEVGGVTYELTRDVLLRDGDVAARFTFEERLRDDAQTTIEQLRGMNVDITMLTGDGESPAAAVAGRLGIAYDAGLLPDGKVKRLEAMRAKPQAAVAMVGDGLNDAPVLAAADVSFAMGSATDLARQAGNIHLMRDALEAVPTTLRLARHAMGRIRLNLLWAFGYNTVGLALAAMGLLNPILAALAMLGSSLLIVLTSRGAGEVE